MEDIFDSERESKSQNPEDEMPPSDAEVMDILRAHGAKNVGVLKPNGSVDVLGQGVQN